MQALRPNGAGPRPSISVSPPRSFMVDTPVDPLPSYWHGALASIHSTLNLCRLAAVAEDVVSGLVQADRARVWYVDSIAEALYRVDEAGRKTSYYTPWHRAPSAYVDALKAGRGCVVSAGHTSLEGREGRPGPIDVDSPEEDLDIYPDCSTLIVPVMDCAKGVMLVVAYREPDREPFSQSELRTANTVASHLSIAYSNAAVYTEAERRQRDAEILNKLAESVYMNSGSRSLVKNILRHAATHLNADRCSLFMVDKERNEFYSEVFEMSSTHRKPTNLLQGWSSPAMGVATFDPLQQPTDRRIRFSIKLGIAGYVAATGETVRIPNAYEDPRFNPAIDKELGYRTRSIMCTPVRNIQGEVIGVAQIINKKYGTFTKEDSDWLEQFMVLCRMALHQSHTLEMEKRTQGQRDVLMQTVETVARPEDMSALLASLLVKAKALVHAHAAAILLMSNRRGVLSQRWLVVGEEAEEKDCTSEQTAISLDDGIVGYVALTGDTLCLSHAVTHPDYRLDTDGVGSYQGSYLLCAPIRYGADLVGVMVCWDRVDAKQEGPGAFTDEDVKIIRTLCSLCAHSIVKSKLYRKAMKAKHRAKLAFEIISYHTHFSKDELEELKQIQLVPEQVQGSDSFNWYPQNFTDLEMCAYTVGMFNGLGLMSAFDLNRDLLCEFVLTVMHNYRQLPYHNWTHAFSVTHTFFTIANKVNLGEFLLDHEILAQLVACLVHDLDHRGKNNAFMQTRGCEMKSVYGDKSILEHHHYAHFMTLVKQGSIKLFDELAQDLAGKIFDHVKHCILATDLANHFPNLATFKKFVRPGSKAHDGQVMYERNNPEHRRALSGMLMTCCDIANCTKTWDVQMSASERVYQEFFAQGDEEKKAGQQPIPMMDRETANIPELQVGFLQHVCVPTYQALAGLLHETQPMVDGVTANLKHWHSIREDHNQRRRSGTISTLYLPSL